MALKECSCRGEAFAGSGYARQSATLNGGNGTRLCQDCQNACDHKRFCRFRSWVVFSSCARCALTRFSSHTGQQRPQPATKACPGRCDPNPNKVGLALADSKAESTLCGGAAAPSRNHCEQAHEASVNLLIGSRHESALECSSSGGGSNKLLRSTTAQF